MKKLFFILALSVFFYSLVYADTKVLNFESSGEVTSVDPVYGRVTIKHPAIKGFSGDGETEFVVKTPELLKAISKSDLVNFSASDEKGDVRIDKITRTGVAQVKEESVSLGRMVQDAIVATGDAAKTVSSPIAPAHELVSGTVGATTEATNTVLHDADPEIKKKF